MAEKPRRLLNPLKNAASLNTFTHRKQTHKDKRLLIDFFIPDSVCLRCASSSRLVVD